MPQRRAWQQGWWSGARASPSPNFGPRPPGTAVTLVVLHSISLPPGVFGGDHVERLFTNRLDTDAPDAHPFFASLGDLRVSAHFFVRRNGFVQQFVSCDERAWHAGVSCWRGRNNCNDWSIGIELEGLEGGLFEAAQYDRLGSLLPLLCGRYPLQEAVGHEHIAPGRKADPGAGFDWTRLRRALRGRGPRLPVIAYSRG
jgi:AmpD protein